MYLHDKEVELTPVRLDPYHDKPRIFGMQPRNYRGFMAAKIGDGYHFSRVVSSTNQQVESRTQPIRSLLDRM